MVLGLGLRQDPGVESLGFGVSTRLPAFSTGSYDISTYLVPVSPGFGTWTFGALHMLTGTLGALTPGDWLKHIWRE